MKGWKCTICGEVLYSDEVPELCPRCGVGSAFFEPYEEAHEVFVNTDLKVVIVGGGIAAVSAAETLRQLDKGCQIDLFSLEEELPYERTRLSKELFQSMNHTFALHDRTWYEELQIRLHTNDEVIQLYPEQQEIETLSHKRLPYDRLILAMGAHAFIPPIPGNDLQGVFSLRTHKDALEITIAAQKSRRCVIVGGGILGLETACALADAHLEVHVIEAMPALMAKQMDPIGSELLKAYIEKQKIHVHVNTQIKAFHGISRVETVELEHGRCINTDFVVVSAGIRANLQLVKHTQIEHEHYIHVNEQLETNIPNIYAVGDVASCAGYHDGLWATAQRQGESVAMQISGKHTQFTPMPQPMFFHHDEFTLFMIGDVRQMDQHIEFLDEQQMKYVKYSYREGICSGVLIVNMANEIDKGWNAFQSKQSFQEMK